MNRWIFSACAILAMTRGGWAQDYIGAGQEFVGSGQEFVGPGSVGSNEPLFSYDDQERWKHGWIQAMPYYGGYESFRPYNYHHVFGQATTAQGWGMSMPYSQQFWHRYENMTNLALSAPDDNVLTPVPQQQYQQQPQNFHPLQQQQQQQLMPPQPQYQAPAPTPAPVPQAGWQMPQQGAYQTQYIEQAAPQQQLMQNYLRGPVLPSGNRR
ncbi:MAG: hypothetical protein KDA90_07405 [Planctomycetaceae bacterium]|nr:hypothetical protein [Planctomycetaceae bacterium]